MGKMSRDKGKRYERELASQLRGYGFDARRSAQYAGNTGEAADVVGLPGIHIEAKHVETMRLYEWMSQAIHDAGEAGRGDLPAVFHRKNGEKTLVTMRLEGWIVIYTEWAAGEWLKGQEEKHE